MHDDHECTAGRCGEGALQRLTAHLCELVDTRAKKPGVLDSHYRSVGSVYQSTGVNMSGAFKGKEHVHLTVPSL